MSREMRRARTQSSTPAAPASARLSRARRGFAAGRRDSGAAGAPVTAGEPCEGRIGGGLPAPRRLRATSPPNRRGRGGGTRPRRPRKPAIRPRRGWLMEPPPSPPAPEGRPPSPAPSVPHPPPRAHRFRQRHPAGPGRWPVAPLPPGARGVSRRGIGSAPPPERERWRTRGRRAPRNRASWERLCLARTRRARPRVTTGRCGRDARVPRTRPPLDAPAPGRAAARKRHRPFTLAAVPSGWNASARRPWPRPRRPPLPRRGPYWSSGRILPMNSGLAFSSSSQ